MRASAVLREAAKNVTSGTTRAPLLALTLVAIASGLILADLACTQQIAQRAAEFHGRGASVEVLSADNRIDGSACEDLAKLPGVRAAGALRNSQDRVVPSALPGSPIPTGAVTPGLVQLIGGAVRSAGVLIGPEVHSRLGPSADVALQTTSGPVPVGGTYDYPDDGRRAGLRYFLAVPVPVAGNFDECWADIWPTNSSLTQLLFTTVLPGQNSSSPAELFQLNTTMGTSFDVADAVERRATRLAAPAGAGLGVLIGFGGVFGRRLELSSALHAGVSRRALLGVMLIESGLWLAIAGTISCTVGVFAARPLGPDLTTTLAVSSFQIALASVLGGLAGTCVAFTAIRENQLFRYFKTR